MTKSRSVGASGRTLVKLKQPPCVLRFRLYFQSKSGGEKKRYNTNIMSVSELGNVCAKFEEILFMKPSGCLYIHRNILILTFIICVFSDPLNYVYAFLNYIIYQAIVFFCSFIKYNFLQIKKTTKLYCRLIFLLKSN